MTVWQVDFYRRPLQDDQGKPLWELLICDTSGKVRYRQECPQAQVSAEWLAAQIRQLQQANPAPDRLVAFRPQTWNLLEPAGKLLGIAVEPQRHTPELKQWLQERSRLYPTLPNFIKQPYDPLQLDRPAPVPLPENLWGDRWRFASLTAGELVDAFRDRPIPVLQMPEALLPLNLGIASTTSVAGVVIDGGRSSMRLALWLQAAYPVSLNFIAGAPDGLILEAGLVDRWVVATFEDREVAAAAREFEQRKAAASGLHFLLVQPDDSGMTYSGFWLLRSERESDSL